MVEDIDVTHVRPMMAGRVPEPHAVLLNSMDTFATVHCHIEGQQTKVVKLSTFVADLFLDVIA
jgi:hypothetical protein